MAATLPKLIIFASGTKDGGGSGFEKLVEAQKEGVLKAEIVAVVSNWPEGGVAQRAARLEIPFEHLGAPYISEKYLAILEKYGAEWVSLSGWLKLVPVSDPHKDPPTPGLDPKRSINIHPGPLPRFGGGGMYGKKVHEAVWAAFEEEKGKEGAVKGSGPTMHFVTAEYDEGPAFFHVTAPLEEGDGPEGVAKKVNELEHKWQAWATNLVVNGEIAWDGKDKKSLRVPEGYQFLPPQH
uniref:phosphoribosylglycinamide formyltransferase 1 n=1 Tax=Chromera velia CCMP2878 TaxID=1169474 RepID=A0A0G4HLU9_9ALVE|eukprot:Cvel_29052.t1-p1 / transcript=Cvel_29052.t1 / gene=Cvel_29052 / organism=Chromera_velia_CCMP2878 / gene_product=Phosphoribosylglycinamide formyltransferase,, putative / transcript_product=Phosphoribosylglycinamide formyltransferase,, putative / location=Cvel_scaffold3916:9707-11994(+) / protein_length=236 / sequence_SO=supercontig / SO=protein_coding / is_pseudo=false